MKIGIVSDTHDNIEAFVNVSQIFIERSVELVIHWGDWISPKTVATFVKILNVSNPKIMIQGVLGNNDGDVYGMIQEVEANNLNVSIQKEVLEEEIDGKMIAVYHGTEDAITQALLSCGKYNAVFCGHTHIPKTEMIGNTLCVNPGCIYPVSAGKILSNLSLAIYDTQTNQADIVFFPRYS